MVNQLRIGWALMDAGKAQRTAYARRGLTPAPSVWRVFRVGRSEASHGELMAVITILDNDEGPHEG